jgi:16S rRNA (cytidine1402-2'-O)-methyltransferase
LSTLYIVATPLGNLKDMTFRAVEILQTVDIIAAEDTRHSQKLLQHYGISRKIMSHHKDNELKSAQQLIKLLKSGQSVALISDAGTPLISDPGFKLVALAHENHITVSPIPGASAAIAALSVSGLSCDKFVFEGFLPATKNTRISRLNTLKSETRTCIFYEAPHRLIEALKDLSDVFGETREVVFARELTKTFETIYKSTLGKLLEFVQQDSVQCLGEIVLIVAGLTEVISEEKLQDAESEGLLRTLLQELPMKQAVKIACEVLKVSKNKVYEKALTFKTENFQNRDR